MPKGRAASKTAGRRLRGAVILARVLALALILAPAGPGARGDDASGGFWRRDAALAAYERRDYKAAMAVWRPLARSGDPRAETWIGILYLRGEGVAQDRVAAAGWFRKAAKRGFGEAEYRLGLMYAFGTGVDRDKATAARYFEAAANHHHARAQLELSEMYQVGVGVPFDMVRAYMWASIALNFVVGPGHDREWAIGNRDTMAEMLPPAQIAEGKRLVRAWMRQHGGAE